MIYYLLIILSNVFSLVHSETIETDAAQGVLQCNFCVDRFNWTHCDETAQLKNCADKLVQPTHNFQAQYNPGLNNTNSSGSIARQFRCFRLELEIDVSSVNVFIRGCTYDDTSFCEGWNANGAKGINCATCSTGVCDRNATWDVLPMTTTTVESSTSTSELSTTTVSSTVQSSSTESITETPCIVNWTTAITTTTVETAPSELSTTSSSSTASTCTIVTNSTASTSTIVPSSTLSGATESTSQVDVETTLADHQTGVTLVGPAFNCTECESAVSWEHCMNRSRTVQCTTAAVNEIHSGLLQFNPNLPVGNYSKFKCYRIKANFSGTEHDGVAYGMGCTFASARFCRRSEWNNVTILECSGASSLKGGSVMGWTIISVLMVVICQIKGKY